MRPQFVRFLQRAQFWLQKRSEVGRFEGISLADLREESTHFRETLLAALRLLKEIDPLRFARVQREIAWIVNCTLSGPGAEYHVDTRTCKIDFEEPTAESDPEFSIGWHARTLVHEATHGILERHGIAYDAELRPRVERLCVTEEKRFLRRLAVTNPDLAESLDRDFKEEDWNFAWHGTAREHISSLFRRRLERSRDLTNR